MKNVKLNTRQQALVNEYYEYGKTVVVTNFHFADGKELSTGYSLEDAYQEAAVALCIAAAHFNADREVLFKTYAATVIRNHLKAVSQAIYESDCGKVSSQKIRRLQSFAGGEKGFCLFIYLKSFDVIIRVRFGQKGF